jgi:TATA-box binding protein (TBP) (component of TFIID and TFIIIB)
LGRGPLFSGQKLDSQTLAAFSATCVDDSAATACFHTNQKAVCTGAASFRRLISAFHDFSKKLSPEEIRETNDYLKFLGHLRSFIYSLFNWFL